MSAKIPVILFIFPLSFIAIPFSSASAEPLKMNAAALIGYDNNTGLDAGRKEDLFAEEMVSLTYSRPLTDRLKMRLSSFLFNVNYFEATDNNVFIPMGNAGMDTLVIPGTVFQWDYRFKYIYFPNDETATALEHEGRVGLKQRISDRLQIRAGFGVLWEDFQERKIRQASGVLSADEERNDLRLVVDSEAAFRILENVLLKAGFIYYSNDSNDQFHDYYDYGHAKYYASLHWQWSSKVSAYVKAAYENRDYGSRPLLDQPSVFEDDDIYTGLAALYYQLQANMALGVSYHYRQKNSNEPSQKYSGSITTLGLYYSF